MDKPGSFLSPKKFLILIAGILIALVVLLFTYRDINSRTGFDSSKKLFEGPSSNGKVQLIDLNSTLQDWVRKGKL